MLSSPETEAYLRMLSTDIKKVQDDLRRTLNRITIAAHFTILNGFMIAYQLLRNCPSTWIKLIFGLYVVNAALWLWKINRRWKP